VLWFLQARNLNLAYWTGTTFNRREFGQLRPVANAGFAVDPGWHFLYFVETDGSSPNLHCLHRRGKEWIVEKMGDERISKVLGVDTLSHAVFAYDPQAGGIRRYAYDVNFSVWSSSVIAGGLGEAGDAAAIDSTRHVIYSSHETADSGVPRHAKATSIGDPTGIGAYQPWPLVETRWNGFYWLSRVIDETGVPQQPAVRVVEQTVFYAKRDDGRLLRTFKAAGSDEADVFATLEGWSGTDSYQDRGDYEVREPEYPDDWSSFLIIRTNSTTFGNVTAGNGSSGVPRIALRAPITIVPVYAPVWTDIAMAPRLTRFRALLSPRDGRLIVHTERCSGEVVRRQSGERVAGYLYRDANGTLVTHGYSEQSSGSSYSELRAESYDPGHPPAYLAALATPDAHFYADGENIVSGGKPVSGSFVRASYSVIPDAPFVPPQLRLPTSVTVRTFGHDYSSSALNQPGARFQHYRNYGTTYAVPSAIAVDRPTGVTFYTQASPRAKDEDSVRFHEEYSYPPLAGFRTEPDPKLPNPESDVWIAMAFDGDRAFDRKTVTPPITPTPVTPPPLRTPASLETKSGLQTFGGNGTRQTVR
jgi:hypothetical protein